MLNKYETLFEKYDIRTPTQGLTEVMKDGSFFVEESDYGRLLKFDSDGKLALEYINRGSNGKLYPLKWFRVVNNIDNSFIEKIDRNHCDGR